MLCTITLFGTFTVHSVMHDPYWNSSPRDLDLAELWSGVEALARYGEVLGLQTACHDQLKDLGNSRYDITTLEGFSAALKLVMRIRVGGLLGMGPDCSSFVFASSPHAQRKATNWAGNTQHQFVRDGNLMASMAAFFMCLAVARGVEAFMENPVGSMIFSFLRDALSNLTWSTTAYLDRCAFVSESQRITEPWLKTYKFLATGKWILQAVKRCTCTQPHAELMDIGPNGERTGRREDMKRSGAYPDSLGISLVNAWRSHSQASEAESDALAIPTPCRAKRAAEQLQPFSRSVEKPSSHPAAAASVSKRPCSTRSTTQGKSAGPAEDEFSQWGDEFAAWPTDIPVMQDEFAAWDSVTPATEDEYNTWSCI
jgi:hypothetical protein